jgi:hypothetical protein
MIRLDKVKYDPSGMQLIYSSEKVRALNMATFLLVHFQYLTPSVAERFLLHTQFCMLEIWLNFDPWRSWNLYNYDLKQWIKVWIEISVVISCSTWVTFQSAFDQPFLIQIPWFLNQSTPLQQQNHMMRTNHSFLQNIFLKWSKTLQTQGKLYFRPPHDQTQNSPNSLNKITSLNTH